jgi:hypothetical protein
VEHEGRRPRPLQAETQVLKAKAVKASMNATPLGTAKLLQAWKASGDAVEKKTYEDEIKKRNLKVTVNVKKSQENPDDVYVKASVGGRVQKTAQVQMKAGASHTFLLPLSGLWPLSGDLAVQVLDYDQLSADDLISNIILRDPWVSVTDTKPRDGAEYETTAEFDK